LQSRLKEFRDHGVQVVAICADSVKHNLRLAEKEKFEFTILSDADLVATDAYGLRHRQANPAGRKDIARPAAFLIDAEGVVQWSFLTDNWRIRLRPEDVLRQLGGE